MYTQLNFQDCLLTDLYFMMNMSKIRMHIAALQGKSKNLNSNNENVNSLTIECFSQTFEKSLNKDAHRCARIGK